MNQLSLLEPAPVWRHPEADRELRLGEAQVGYRLRRARRKSIGFTVTTEGLAVSAPRWVPLGEIERALQTKADWILRKLAEQRARGERQAAARIVWGDGAELPLRGQPLRLRLGAPATRHTPGELALALPPGAAAAQVRDAVQAWLQREARRDFAARCDRWAPLVGALPTRVALSSARTRWGSASAEGVVRLSWRLIQLPEALIDYVVVHELAHLHELNHSPAFWAHVARVLPDHATRRQALREVMLDDMNRNLPP